MCVSAGVCTEQFAFMSCIVGTFTERVDYIKKLFQAGHEKVNYEPGCNATSLLLFFFFNYLGNC